jgi:hypothetical protein
LAYKHNTGGEKEPPYCKRRDTDMSLSHAPNAPKKNYPQLRSDLKKAKATLALAFSLRDFFREHITVARAEEEIKMALDNRHETFLELVRTQIYERPHNPYQRLLKQARCEFSDLRTHVHYHGLEGTLEQLAREGVYLTANEFKGKKEVVRGGQSFRVSPSDFERPDSSPGFITQSSGTSNRPVRSLKPLDRRAIQTSGLAVFFSAHNLFSYSHAAYEAILPGSAGVSSLLGYAKLGIRTERWFARKIPVNSRLESWYHYLTTSLIVMMGKWFGPGFPRPEFLDIQDVHRIIVRWVTEKKRKGKVSCIRTASSNAVRIARVAWEMGISLEGTKFLVHGEPFTEAKREWIERVGATAIPAYYGGHSFGGGYGCANPLYTDEVHAHTYNLALIPHPKPLSKDGPPIHPLLFTTLHPSAPRLLLNVENGDYATLEKRDCGCALENVGLTLHLHHIRSYEKFTSEGMNYFYGDLFEFFEKTLPSQFGGGPGDYQLVEEEDGHGQTRLSLLVHPEVENLNEERLLLQLQQALSEGPKGNWFMAQIWQNAGTFRIRREVPHASPGGKILPLHIPVG